MTTYSADIRIEGYLTADFEADAGAVKAGEGGRLFGAVTPADIASALTETTGEAVDKRTIAVKNPIRSLGAHEVSVRLHDEVSATVALNVVKA